MPAFAGMFLVLEEGQLLPALRLRLSATTRSSLLRLTLSFLLHFAFGFFLDLTLSFFLRLTFSSLLLGFPFRYFFLSSFLLRLTLGDLPFRRRFFPRYFPLLGDFALRSFFT